MSIPQAEGKIKRSGALATTIVCLAFGNGAPLTEQRHAASCVAVLEAEPDLLGQLAFESDLLQASGDLIHEAHQIVLPALAQVADEGDVKQRTTQVIVAGSAVGLSRVPVRLGAHPLFLAAFASAVLSMP